jgi:hypothetical protein
MNTHQFGLSRLRYQHLLTRSLQVRLIRGERARKQAAQQSSNSNSTADANVAGNLARKKSFCSVL